MAYNRHINIPVFIPHKGCPHTCVFCDQKKISGAGPERSLDKVKKLLDESLSTVGAGDEVEIAFFGGSFTGIPETEMMAYLSLARPYIEDKKVQGIRLSTRPDYIDAHILSILKDYSVTAIELGVQSLDDDILKMSRRGHTVKDVITACSLIKESGIRLGIQTMLGLPGDTMDKAMKTVQGVLELEPDMVRIYPVVVLEGTYLEVMFKNGQYSPLGLDEAVEWCAGILPLYKNAGITVLRIGLHASDTLEGSIVTGPYHPAFGELVESRIILNRLIEQIRTLSVKDKKLKIRTRPDMVSKLVGQKRANIKTIKEKFLFDEVIIQPDLAKGEFEIEI